MKKLITFLFAVLITAINASATITFSDDGKTCTIEDLSTTDVVPNGTDLSAVEKLIIKGTFDGNNNLWNNTLRTGMTQVKEIDLRNMDPAGMTSSVAEAFKNNFSLVESFYFPEGITSIPFCCNGKQHLSYVYLPNSVKEIQANAFQNCSLTEITLPYGLEYIRYHAFDNSALTSIAIPGTVKLIESDAFSVCNALSKVIFEEVHEGDPAVNMTIKNNAFQNANNVWDVYVETEGTITCENEAFSLDVTNAHGATGHRYSTLHYPSDKAEEYVNQKHALTAAIASDPAQFHDWLVAHLQKAQQAANGWYEFVNAGPSPDPDEQPTGETFLKTWSEYGVQKKGDYVDGELTENESGETVYYLARLVPDGVRAYIVHAVTPSGSDAYTITLKRVRVIPPNTGVILYGQSNSQTKEGLATLVMTQVPYIGYPMSRDYWNLNEKDGEGKIINKNYLIGTANSSVHVEPFDKVGDNVTFRNFFLTKFTATDTYRKNKQTAGWESANADYVGFFRAKSSNLAAGKAYLHLAADEFDLAEGNECIVLKDEQFNLEYSDTEKGKLITKQIPGTNPAQNYWDGRKWDDPVDSHNWGDRTKFNGIDDYLVSFRGEFENDVDGLVTLTIPTEVVNEYFTLQGVKVNKPTKRGIYIKNGKKVVIK